MRTIRTLRVLCYVLLLPISGFTTAPDSSSRWKWFRARANAETGWSMYEGEADVAIAGNSFKASLWDAAAPTFARLSLIGTITGSRVTVKVTVNASDYDEPYRVSGTRKRTCWNGGGRESIIFTSSTEVVGLAHELTEAHCRGE